MKISKHLYLVIDGIVEKTELVLVVKYMIHKESNQDMKEHH